MTFEWQQSTRRNDPMTSHEAAMSAAGLASKHHAIILAVLKAADRPMAAEEIAQFSRDCPPFPPILDKVLVGRRMCELERAGLIVKTTERHVNRSGRGAFRYALA